MNKVSICIAAYKRPAMVKSLLLSIVETNKYPSLVNSVSILIVDNNTERSSKQVVDQFNLAITHGFKVQFDIESEKGISKVRNRLMKNTLEIGSDILIYADDDEFVTSIWLNEMVRCTEQKKADVVIGPLIPVFDKNTPEYFTHWSDRPRYSNYYTVDALQTGNMLMRCNMLLKNTIWFDSNFNFSSLGDTYFGIQFAKKEIRFYWADKAVVNENIPATRSNVKWILKRFYRGASTFTYISKIENNVTGIIKKFLVRLAHIVIGSITSIFAIFNFRQRYWGAIICRRRWRIDWFCLFAS